MLAIPDLATPSDAQKQELAEAFMVQALLIRAACEQAQRDAGKLRQIAAAVCTAARALGLDVDAMTLTEAGFLPVTR